MSSIEIENFHSNISSEYYSEDLSNDLIGNILNWIYENNINYIIDQEASKISDNIEICIIYVNNHRFVLKQIADYLPLYDTYNYNNVSLYHNDNSYYGYDNIIEYFESIF